MQQTNIHFNNHESTSLSVFRVCVCRDLACVVCVCRTRSCCARPTAASARENLNPPQVPPPEVVSAITTRATA